MEKIIENLRKFYAKERFHLFGVIYDNRTLKLNNEFKDYIESEFNLQIPENAFIGFDYHLDWLYASVLTI
ncbi:MAG: hypothetical protein HY738_21795 [Bacteroidia bacterium]|nr:hypothetical protein [Bacteroidia bacterium]